jgi:hypothetical protein
MEKWRKTMKKGVKQGGKKERKREEGGRILIK